MQKNTGAFVFIMVVLAAALAACGGAAATPTPAGVELSQTFSASEGGITINFNYPEGWVTNGEGGQISLANSQAALDLVSSGAIESVDIPDDGYGMQIVLLPGAEMPPDSSPSQLLTMMAEGASQQGVTVENIQEVQVNGENGAKANVTFPNDAGEMYLFQNGENYVMVFAAASAYDGFRSTTEAIVNSIRVQSE